MCGRWRACCTKLVVPGIARKVSGDWLRQCWRTTPRVQTPTESNGYQGRVQKSKHYAPLLCHRAYLMGELPIFGTTSLAAEYPVAKPSSRDRQVTPNMLSRAAALLGSCVFRKPTSPWRRTGELSASDSQVCNSLAVKFNSSIVAYVQGGVCPPFWMLACISGAVPCSCPLVFKRFSIQTRQCLLQ